MQALATGIDVADIAWNVDNRNQDLKHREIEVTWRRIDDIRRQIDEKTQQLKNISHLSALLAGFSMVCMVEVNIPDDISHVLLFLYGSASALTIGLMLMAMLNCTLILVAILKYDTINERQTFLEFWERRCEQDWRRSFKAFTLGVSCFMVTFSLLGWVVFHQSKPAASIVSVIALLSIMYWLASTARKWASYIREEQIPARGRAAVVNQPDKPADSKV